MSDFVERGRLLLKNRRYEAAEQELLRAAAEDPDDFLPHCLLAACRMNLGRMEEAIASAREAVQLAPTLSAPYLTLALVYIVAERLGDAETAAVEACSLQPDQAVNHATLARVHCLLHRYDQALAAAKTALACDGQHVEALRLSAEALVKLNRLDEAEQMIRSAAALEPNNAAVLAALGGILMLQKKNEAEAFEAIQRAKELDPALQVGELSVEALGSMAAKVQVSFPWERLPEGLVRDPSEAKAHGQLAAYLTVRNLHGLEAFSAFVAIVWGLITIRIEIVLGAQYLLAAFLLATVPHLLITFRRFVLALPLLYAAALVRPRGWRLLNGWQRLAAFVLATGVLTWVIALLAACAQPTAQMLALARLTQAPLLSAAYFFKANAGYARYGHGAILIVLTAACACLAAVAAAGWRDDLEGPVQALYFTGVALAPYLAFAVVIALAFVDPKYEAF